MASNDIKSGSRNVNIIISVSILVPLLVAVLIFMPAKINAGSWIYFLPDLHAVINSLTAVVLVLALIAIKSGNIVLHRSLMISCFFLGALFLVSYIIYHSSAVSAKFGDTNFDGVVSAEELSLVGQIRTTYLFILFSHIALSMVVVPLVLFAFYFALTEKIEKHRKIVKWTFPIWLYVSITGVVVYLMISPYYPY